MKVLIIEDNAQVAEAISLCFQLRWSEVAISTTPEGNTGIETLKSASFDIVILDIKLPDMEGTDLLKLLHQSLPKMMKIMVTGYPKLENAINSLNMGANAYLMKPINPKELLKVLYEKLVEQEKAEEMNNEKVNQWIETRVRKLKHGES